MEISKYRQMYAWLTRPGYNQGGLATPKRGLVDEPGSYSGNPYANSPKFKKFLKEYGNYNRIADVVKAYERMLSTEGKVVGIKKLHEALGPNNPYTFETFNNIFSRADKKITKNISNVEKNYIKAGQRLKKIIIDNIGEPELLGDIQKKYKNIKTTGTSTDKVFTLNKNKIKRLNNALNKNYNVTGFRENTIDNVFKLIDDEDFMKSLKAYKGGRIDETSPLFKKLFKAGSGDMPYAYMTLGRVLRGEIVMEGIKKNKVLGDKIIKSISGDFQGPMGTAAKRWAKFQMAKHFDDPNASYSRITQTIKNAFKDAGVKNIDIDEIFPARTGQITIGKGSGAYNQIVQFIDSDINAGAKRSFDGRASKRYQLIIDAYKNKNFDKVKQLVDGHQTDINNFYKRNPEAKGKVKLTQLNYNPKTKKFASPTDIYGKDVLPSKVQKDIDKFYRKTGLSLDVGSTMTLEKAAAEIKKGGLKNLAKEMRAQGFKCTVTKANGGPASCNNPRAYLDDIAKQREIARTGSGQKAINAARKLRGLKTFMTSQLGPAAIAGEIAFAVPFALADYASGESTSRIINFATLGVFGDSVRDEIVKYGGEEAGLAFDAQERGKQLEQIEEQGEMFMGPDDSMLYPDQLKGATQRFEKSIEPFVQTDPSLPPGIGLRYFDSEMADQSFNKLFKAQDDIADKKAILKQERTAEPEDYYGFGAARGGIANVRRPGAIPPDSGPMPQGLESLLYYVK